MNPEITSGNEISNIVIDLTAEAYIRNAIDQQPPDFSKWSIYRVPERLQNMNPEAYIPKVISIGPLHHGRKKLMATEPLKIYCLKSYLPRLNYTAEQVVGIARGWETDARNCYAEHINMNSDDFVKMMLVDGCFIIMLLIIANKDLFVDTENKFDLSFFKVIWFDINRDLIMLENQLPFFVLDHLFDLLPPAKKKNEISFIKLMADYLSHELIELHFLICNRSGSNVFHKLVDHLFSETKHQRVDHLIDLLSLFYIPTNKYLSHESLETESGKFRLPPTLSQLSKAGIKVKKAETLDGISLRDKNLQEIRSRHIKFIDISLLDISFENGVLKIPPFEINNEFEFYVRNLMAFEHLRKLESDSDSVFYKGIKTTKKSYVLDYIQFLDGLLSTEEDVALLVKEGIITNHIGGSNEEVSQIFNNLCKYTPIPHEFYYHKTSEELHDYCKKWRHQSMATLRRDYFNSPWAWISFFAATFLILLTCAQTVFSILSFSNKY